MREKEFPSVVTSRSMKLRRVIMVWVGRCEDGILDEEREESDVSDISGNKSKDHQICQMMLLAQMKTKDVEKYVFAGIILNLCKIFRINFVGTILNLRKIFRIRGLFLKFDDDNGSIITCCTFDDNNGLMITSSKGRLLEHLPGCIKSLFVEHGLSSTKVRGYDGAINMHDELHGLKALIVNEKKVDTLYSLFYTPTSIDHSCNWKKHHTSCLMNAVSACCKRKDMLIEKKVVKVIGGNEIETESGVHQEFSLTRVGDIHLTLLRFVGLYPCVIVDQELTESVLKTTDPNLN
ncbi:LOW QUALITY PROTEIN: hypothetical protein OSB04_012376 [Centaurea solstitialis]|uniref:Uncharacterized protein n=1 Tax=Centaurea solstitialis TaxID=347529 RepID=A0AA38WEJ1_9ASTR|nr:LOW QUALITY PROTEIN: hypothetical protein OSB04_012376 [Centaurea solstitialis]